MKNAPPTEVLAAWRNTNRNRNRLLPRIHIDDLWLPANVAYFEGREPFMLTGAFAKWNLSSAPVSESFSAAVGSSQSGERTELFTPEWFAETFAQSTVDFYPHNMPRSTSKPYLTPMAPALHELAHPTEAYPRDRSFSAASCSLVSVPLSSIWTPSLFGSQYPGGYIQWNMCAADWAVFRARMKPLPERFRFDDVWLDACLPTPELRDQLRSPGSHHFVPVSNVLMRAYFTLQVFIETALAHGFDWRSGRRHVFASGCFAHGFVADSASRLEAMVHLRAQ